MDFGNINVPSNGQSNDTQNASHLPLNSNGIFLSVSMNGNVQQPPPQNYNNYNHPSHSYIPHQIGSNNRYQTNPYYSPNTMISNKDLEILQLKTKIKKLEAILSQKNLTIKMLEREIKEKNNLDLENL